MPLKPKSKKRGAKSASFEDNFSGTDEELSDIIRHNIQYFGAEPPADDEETLHRITQMFQYCAENNSIPTVEKLALCLGITRHELYVWEKRGDKGVSRSRMIKIAKEIIASIDAEAVAQGKLNTVAYIFRAKNYYGLTDNVTVEHKAAQPLGDTQDQSMLVGALLKQLQAQGQPTIDFQPQEGQATIPATIAETSSDYSEPSDYQPEEQATISPLSALGKALAAELDAERLSSDYSAGSQGENDPEIIDVLPEGEKS